MTHASLARWTATAAILFHAVLPASALNLPFGIGSASPDGQVPRLDAPAVPREAPVRIAQAGDPVERINRLEEENRRLNGRIEELSFQMLQMQEQIRKAQEDNQFRFQELESAKGGAAPQKRSDAAPPANPPQGSGGAEMTAAPPATTDGSTPPGDEIGGLLGGGLDTSGLPGATTPPAAATKGSGTVASIKPSSAGGMYDLAYNYLLAGDYKLAEDSFRQYAQTYPDAADAPDAKYWLGESLFAQAKYTDAAEVFLNAQKSHPKSGKAPEMMLKLGMSLAKLDNRETACITFKEVAKRYPQMSANVKRKLQTESAASNC